MAVAATGFFDGVHLGHRLVIETLVSQARRRGEESLVVTFWPHPRVVLQKEARDLRLLTSLDEKLSLLRSLGVDRIETVPFSREFASMDADAYLKMLSEKYGVDGLVVGYDTRIGSDQVGPEDLLRMAESVIGPSVMAEAYLAAPSVPVSSSLIRCSLAQGRVQEAESMLGRPYAISGIVVGGKQLGRTIGFPTANLQLSDPLRQVPGRGVYLSRTEVGGRVFSSMTNVGDVIETNIFGFDEDIYGHEIRVSFMRRIRDMRSFSSLDELKAQLAKDREECMGIVR